MGSDSRVGGGNSEARDYYAVLGAEPSATAAELRTAFREAVLRFHPDRAHASSVATRRTSVLNRAWSTLRDPLRRLHYDRALEAGRAETLQWPLDEGEVARPSARRAGSTREAAGPSPWHQPQWRSVAGFRVPADVWLAGPAAQEAWIIRHHIAGADWRERSERYWLRFAIGYYRERGLADDWLGALERLMELETNFESIVRDRPREAFVATGAHLRGAAALRRLGERFADGTPQRRWVDRELRGLLGEFRDARVRRGTPEARAESAELLLNYLEALGMRPSFGDVRAAVAAHRRAGHLGRAAELVERVAAEPVDDAARWYGIVQLLTEVGQVERASSLLAAIARGEHPDALDPGRIRGQPARRLSAARRRLELAQRRLERAAPGA